MNLEATIREAARLELELSTTEDRQLSVKPKSRITPELRNAFREHKAEIIAALLVSDGVSEEVARREAGLPREKPRNIICLSDVQRPPDPYTAEEFEEYVSDLVGKGVSESRARMLAYERLNGRKELPQDLEELEDAYWDAVAELHGRGEKRTFDLASVLCDSFAAGERCLGADVLAQLGAVDGASAGQKTSCG